MATKTTTTEKTTTEKAAPAPKEKDILLTTTIAQLQAALPALKETLGDKKFDKRIKKAAKLLTAGVKTKAPKKVIPIAKKATSKKAAAPKKKAAKAPAEK